MTTGRQSIRSRLTIVCFVFLIALLFFTINSSPPKSPFPSYNKNPNPSENQFSETLIHYATSKTTPQQTLAEISVTNRILRRHKSPCNFLIFGLGHDSLMWASLNPGGRTLFLEEDSSWIQKINSLFPSLHSLHVTYNTKLRHANDLLLSSQTSQDCSSVVDPRESRCSLALKTLPDEVYEVDWDVIMIDAPTGYHPDSPGRMGAIYTAGLLARNRVGLGVETHVMVHDVDRRVEDRFSKAFLCEGYLTEQVGRLRHFVVPSHRSRPGSLFCPA